MFTTLLGIMDYDVTETSYLSLNPSYTPNDDIGIDLLKSNTFRNISKVILCGMGKSI